MYCMFFTAKSNQCWSLDIFPRQRHLPRQRWQETRQAKTLTIRLIQDSDDVKMFETDTATVQLSRQIIAIKQ